MYKYRVIILLINKPTKNFISFLKSITPFELSYMVLTIIALIISIVLFPNIMLEDTENAFLVVCSVISVISSPICEILISKQSRYWTIFSLFFVEITDTCIYFSLGLYSTALVSCLFWIPMDLITFVRWNKCKDEEKPILTKVRKLPTKYSILTMFGIVLVGCGLGSLLTLIPGNAGQGVLPYIIAFSNIFEILNGIFILLRYTEQWMAWMAYLLCQTIVYISLGHYIMLITIFAMIVNTVYGFIKWFIYSKRKSHQLNV